MILVLANNCLECQELSSPFGNEMSNRLIILMRWYYEKCVGNKWFIFLQISALTYMSDYRRGMNWWMDLLSTYTQHSELQVITALSVIFTLYTSPHHPLSIFSASCVFISRFLATACKSGDYSAPRAQVVSSVPSPVCRIKKLKTRPRSTRGVEP
jgi:hypothetical protein